MVIKNDLFFGGVMVNDVKKLRKKLNLTTEEFSQKIGISKRYLQFIESNKRTPSLLIAKKIADELYSTIDDVFFSKEENNEEKN